MNRGKQPRRRAKHSSRRPTRTAGPSFARRDGDVSFASRWEAHLRAYWEGIRRARAERPARTGTFPAFMDVGPKRWSVFQATDGFLVIEWPSDGDSDGPLEFKRTMAAVVQLAARETSMFGIRIRLPVPLPSHIEFASPEIQQVAQDGSPAAPAALAPWSRIIAMPRHEAAELTAEFGRTRGELDVLKFWTAAELGIKVEGDPKAEVISRLRTLADQFERLLDLAEREEDIQRFIAENPIILNPAYVECQPKVKLGAEYVTDFAIILSDDNVELVEIEPSKFPLFVADSAASAKLTHAEMQVLSWLKWIRDNRAYAIATIFPNMRICRGRVIIGRAKPEYEDALERKNQYSSEISFETYDHLIQKVRKYADNLTLL